MDSIVNKNQRKPVIDIQGDTNSVETTDQDSPQILMDSKIFLKKQACFYWDWKKFMSDKVIKQNF